MRSSLLKLLSRPARSLYFNRFFVSVSPVDKSGISVLQIKNEPSNILTVPLMKSIIKEIKTTEANAACRGLIITSGCRYFSTGFDVKTFLNPDKEALTELLKTYRELCRAIYGTRLATIASVNGHALGSGCALLVCCDSRVLSGVARIGFNEVEYGLSTMPWVVKILKDVVGKRNTERLLSLGTIFEPDHAAHIGLVDTVCRKEILQGETYKEALKWSQIPGREHSKKLCRMNRIKYLEDPIHEEAEFASFFELISLKRSQIVMRSYLTHLSS